MLSSLIQRGGMPDYCYPENSDLNRYLAASQPLLRLSSNLQR